MISYKVIEKSYFTEERIFNEEETGIKSVVQAPYTLAARRITQVGQIISGERGKFITMCAFITANANPFSPIFVFIRIQMIERLLARGTSESTGFANSLCKLFG